MGQMRFVYATIDIVCISFVLPLFICVSVRKHRDRKADYFFSLLSIIVLALTVGDIPYWLFTGTSNWYNPYLLQIGTFINYVAGAPLSLVYTNYLVCSIGLEKKKADRIRHVTWILSAFAIAAVIFNLKFNFYYSIDPVTNTYSRGPMWICSQFVGGSTLLYNVYILIKYRKRLVLSAWVGTVLYIMMPVVGSVLQLITDGAPVLTWLTAIALYILYFTVNTEMRYQMEKQKKELTESKTTIMLSQIQPHFLYNSLTTIAALCEKSPMEAKRATLDFSRYLRCNIDSVNKRIPVPFKQELEHVRNYLNLEKLRFEKRLNIIMDIQATEFLIPSLTIQPLVENAVKHGICNREGGKGTLILSTVEEEKCFKVIIRDDGMGFDTTKKPNDGREHIGIENVKSRLYSIIGATMTIESEIGRGTVVTVYVPKETKKRRKSKDNENFGIN